MAIDYYSRKSLGRYYVEAHGLIKKAWELQSIALRTLPDELPPEVLKDMDDLLGKAMSVIRRARKELPTLN